MPIRTAPAFALLLAVAGSGLAACGRSVSSGPTTAPTRGPAGAQAPGAGTVIPFVLVAQPDGSVRPVVNVSVAGGRPVPVLLDTGSTGLYVLASALGPGAVTSGSTGVTQTYANGTEYVSTVRAALVAFGTGVVATPGPIEVGAIGTVGCAPLRPDCPGRTGAAGLVARGLYGTLGVSLTPAQGSRAAIYSPLLQIRGGAQGFAIAYRSPVAGAITIGVAPMAPPASSVIHLSPAAPNRYPNGGRAWDGASAEVCWTIAGSGPRCGPTTFDSGYPHASVDPSGFTGARLEGGTFAPGTTVRLSAGPDRPPFWTFTTGAGSAGSGPSGPPPSYPLTAARPAPSVFATTGTSFFFSHVVTCDAQNGEVIVAPAGPQPLGHLQGQEDRGNARRAAVLRGRRTPGNTRDIQALRCAPDRGVIPGDRRCHYRAGQRRRSRREHRPLRRPAAEAATLRASADGTQLPAGIRAGVG